MCFLKEINEKGVITEIKVNGIRYYIDMDKSVFTESNGEYIKISDEQTLKEILEKFTPYSIDVRQ